MLVFGVLVATPASAHAQYPGVSLSLDDVEAIVRQPGIPEHVKRDLVWDECVGFDVKNAGNLARLRSAGASPSLLGDIRSSCRIIVSDSSVRMFPSGLAIVAWAGEKMGHSKAAGRISYRKKRYTTESDGVQQKSEVWHAAPNRYALVGDGWDRESNQPTIVATGFDGRSAWYASASDGVVHSMMDVAVKANIKSWEISGEWDLNAEVIVSAVSLGDTMVSTPEGQRRCDLVEVERKGWPFPSRECIDKETGYRVLTIFVTPHTMVYTYSGFRSVDGVVYPMRSDVTVKYTDDPKVYRSSHTFQEISHEAFDPKVFTKPTAFYITPLQRQSVAAPAVIQGSLTTPDGRLSRMHYDEITIKHTPNSRVEIEVRPKSFPPLIRIGHIRDGAFRVTEHLFDYDPKKVKTVATTDAGGIVVIHVASGRTNAGGAYEVKVKGK